MAGHAVVGDKGSGVISILSVYTEQCTLNSKCVVASFQRIVPLIFATLVLPRKVVAAAVAAAGAGEREGGNQPD